MPDYPEFDVEHKDERLITIPASANTTDSEAVGDAIKFAAQDGYTIVALSPIQRDYGNQRDPDVRTLGVRVRMVKS
jgi:hypothetical protein